MNVYHAARTAGWSRRRLFGIFRPSFSRHITQVSAVRYLPPFVQSTHHAGVGCSVSSALLSADISRRRRLFGIFRFSFSLHTATASAIRYLPLLVQPTHHSGIGCSVSSALRSADISRRCRLFIHWDIVSATLASCSLIFPLQNLIHAICIFRATPIRQTFCCQFFIWKERMEIRNAVADGFLYDHLLPTAFTHMGTPTKVMHEQPTCWANNAFIHFFVLIFDQFAWVLRIMAFDKCLRQLFQFRICYGFHILQFTEMLRNLPRKNAVTLIWSSPD